MRPTKDLLARGQACAECHVGKGTADVNHDLIAAGHPRLNFEYGSQLAKLPKHWRVADDKARHPDYEAKVWALGQILAGQGVARPPRVAGLPVDPGRLDHPLARVRRVLLLLLPPRAGQDGGPRPTSPGPASRARCSGGPGTLPMAKPLGAVRGSMPTTRPRPLGRAPGRRWPGPPPDAAMVARRARAASDEIGRLADSLNRGQIAPGEIRSMLAGPRARTRPAGRWTGTGRPGSTWRSSPLTRPWPSPTPATPPPGQGGPRPDAAGPRPPVQVAGAGDLRQPLPLRPRPDPGDLRAIRTPSPNREGWRHDELPWWKRSLMAARGVRRGAGRRWPDWPRRGPLGRAGPGRRRPEPSSTPARPSARAAMT